jgi:hypothetical protein
MRAPVKDQEHRALPNIQLAATEQPEMLPNETDHQSVTFFPGKSGQSIVDGDRSVFRVKNGRDRVKVHCFDENHISFFLWE